MDLAVTSSHTQTTFALQIHSVSVEAGLSDCRCCIPLKGATPALGISKTFTFWGCLQNIPTPIHLLCISAGRQQFLCNKEHYILLITFSICF